MVPRQPPGITGALPGTRPPRVEAEFLDVHGACAFTSLSRRTLDYAKDRGDLPFIRCGAKILFRRGDLIGWLERGRIDVRADVARLEATTRKEVVSHE